jgi:radical SAM protein with 4Fe4S-binding SPASM domain
VITSVMKQGLDTLSYGTFSLNLRQKVEGQRIPLSGVIELTRRCPLRCVHCYNNLPPENSKAKSQELSFEEHCRILDEITEAGCFWLLFTGGEILLRKDFLDIYAYAKRKGLLITLFTNGVFLTEEIADFLAEVPPFTIEITLYGHTAETYERITRIPGSFERCLRGVGLLKERRLPLKLKTMALTLNFHEIREMKKFAEEDLGISFRVDPMVNPRIDCLTSPLAFRLKPEDIVALDLGDSKRMEEWKDFLGRYLKPLPADQRSEVYKCGGGVSAFAIDPYGFLSPCVLSSCQTYDLKKGGFRQGWDVFLQDLRTQKSTRRTKCTDCQLIAMCGMCPANAQLENRDPEMPIDFFCQVAHLRAKLLDVSIPPHGKCQYCQGGEKYPELLHSVSNLKKPAKSEIMLYASPG